MTSDSIFPESWIDIDEWIREDHYYLSASDKCYCLGEYTARRGYSYSPTNNLIYNFKKSMDRRDLPEWFYKELAIQTIARAFEQTFEGRQLDEFTFVPIPPSKAKSDPMYDDRLVRMLSSITKAGTLDIREIVSQRESVEPAHSREVRQTPEQIAELYETDRSMVSPTPTTLAIVDDVLTTGAHFRAAATALSALFPNVPMVGLFVARRVPEGIDGLAVIDDST